VRVPPRRLAADELPPAALDAARARDGVRRCRGDARPLPRGDQGALPLLLLRRRHADPVTESPLTPVEKPSPIRPDRVTDTRVSPRYARSGSEGGPTTPPKG